MKKKAEQFYKLKEWERWDSEAERHSPKFCPNCGEKIEFNITYWADSSRPETVENPFREIGYECFCFYCGWLGNIEPDSDSNIVHEHFREGKC